MSKSLNALMLIGILLGTTLVADASEGSNIHFTVIGDEENGVSAWFTGVYSGGHNYIEAMTENGQEVANAKLSDVAQIPDPIIASLVKAWGLRNLGKNVLAPNGGRLKGTAVPESVRVLPSMFVNGGRKGILIADTIDGKTKEPFGISVLWAFLERGANGDWSVSTEESPATHMLYQAVLLDPIQFIPGLPPWHQSPHGDIYLGLDSEGTKFTKEDFPTSPIRISISGGHELNIPMGKPIESPNDTPDRAEKFREFLNAIYRQQRGSSSENGSAIWITDLDGLDQKIGTDDSQPNYLHFKTNATEPEIFFLLAAPPYAVVGVRFGKDEDRTFWSYLVTDKSGDPQFVIKENVIAQDPALSFVSSIFDAAKGAW